MVKGIVKTNKANDTKYIYLPKDCGFIDGDEVEIKNNGIGIYNKERLKEYYEKNKTMFENIKKELKTCNKKHWYYNFETMCKNIGKIMGYGDFIWDDVISFNKGNDYAYALCYDIDGGVFDKLLNGQELKKIIESKKYSKEKLKKEFTDFAIMSFIKHQAEEILKKSDNEEISIMKNYGFENRKDGDMTDFSISYDNGLVQIWYDLEDFNYHEEMNIYTMKDTNILKYEELINDSIKF